MLKRFLSDQEMQPGRLTGCIGRRREPHEIDQITCIRCGVCYQVCNLDAIEIKPAGETVAVSESESERSR